MDLDEIFGVYPPVPYFMGHNSMYSPNFLEIRFGDDSLSNLDLLRDFFFRRTIVLGNDVDVIIEPNFESPLPAGVTPVYHSENDLWGVNREYSSFALSLSAVLDYVESPREEPWYFNVLVVGDGFLLGFSNSWVRVYFADVQKTVGVRKLAENEYDYAYSIINEHGHVAIGRTKDSIPSSLVSKASPDTVTDATVFDKPMHWDRFTTDGIEPIIYNMRKMKNHVRFHIPIEEAGAEVWQLFHEMEIPVQATMVYHGVIAQTLDSNCLLSEETYSDAADGTTLQSFAIPLEDAPAYLQENAELVQQDCTLFFGDGFVFGSYDRGTDFAFFDVNLKAKFEDALLTLGYVPEKSWWEKTEEGEGVD